MVSEEHNGHKFYVEFINKVPSGYWFQIHIGEGTHNITIESEKSLDKAFIEVARSFKEYLTQGNDRDRNTV